MSLKQILTELGLSTDPGKKTTGFIEVAGTEVRMPVTTICGTDPGPDILITGGVHGGEYPCIETAIRLGVELRPADIRGTVVIIHPVNPAAFFAKLQYYGPYDGKNLNRVFPGKALGTVSERIAYTVFQLVQRADFFIDLHGGDIHEALVPFVIYSHLGGEVLAERSKTAAAALGFPYVVGSFSDNGTTGAAALAGVPGFLAELGQCGRWSEAEVAQYLNAVQNVLRHLGTLPEPVGPTDQPAHYQKMAVVQAQDQGCWYPSVELEQQVRKGEKLGEIRDFFGQVLSTYHAEHDGLILYLVTSLAITQGDPLTAIGVV